MYPDLFGIPPTAETLVAQGIGLCTALGFMMAVTALSLPALSRLKRKLRTPLLMLFVVVITAAP
jgi:uncharacterized membrane protein YraQ (UPF0718 family)